MSKFPPSRSQVPVDERSVLATVPGLPWWATILTLLAFTAVGALAASKFAGSNAGMWAIAVGAIICVLAVRNRALFTAIVQPPLVIAVTIPVYRWFDLEPPRKTSKILTDVLFPLISLFPWMFWISVAVLVIGGARVFLYRQLTATARSAQRSARKASTGKIAVPKEGTAGKAAGAKVGKGEAGSPGAVESLGGRLRAALSRISAPAPATGAVALTGGAGARRTPRSGSGQAESGTSARTTRRKSSARRAAEREDAPDSRVGRRRSGERAETGDSQRSTSARGDTSAGRDIATPQDERHRDDHRRAASERRERPSREEIARRDAGAPATRVNRVIRPDSAPHRSQPLRRDDREFRVDEDRRAEVPRGTRRRPVDGEPRLRPLDRDRAGRELPERDGRRHDSELPPVPRPRRRALEPDAARDAPLSGPRRVAQRPESRDYRREARQLERARGDDLPRDERERSREGRGRAAEGRERSRIPRDDFTSLPRLSGSWSEQPDLPSLSRNPERRARATDAPSSNPGRYEHYRPPRYRPEPAESAEPDRSVTNFRDDFNEPDPPPRQIRRHRYKD